MKKIVMTFVMFMASQPVFAQEVPLEKGLAQITNYLNEMKTYQASFRQVTPGQNFVQLGQFYLKSPRKFLWQYHQPGQQKLVSDGGRLFFFDKESEQITQLPFKNDLVKLLTQRPIQIPNKDFKVVTYGSGPDHLEIVLMPRDENVGELGLNKVVLSFDRNPMRLARLVTADALGNETYTFFSDVKQGQQLADSLFKVELPNYDVFAD